MADGKQQAQHQPSEFNVRGVVWGGIAIAIGIAFAAILSYFLWQRWSLPDGERPYGGPNAFSVPSFDKPQLQSAPQLERAQYFAEKRQLLESWGWVDRSAGIARIPVEEAMRLNAEDGGNADTSAGKEQK